MANDRTDIEIALDREGRLLKKLIKLHDEQGTLCEGKSHAGFNEKALEFERLSERLTLTARTVPVATGRPSAFQDVELIMEQEIPVQMGFTEQGWFQLRIPLLLPQKGKGGAEYVRGFLYPAMMRFMRSDLDDETGNLMTLELMAPNQRQAIRLSRLFERKAESVYNLTMLELLDDEQDLDD